MQTKLALINYYYTEMSMLHEEGGSFYKPLWYDYGDDNNTYVNQTNNVLLGSNLKVSHQAQEDGNTTETWYFFPQGNWCSVFNTSAGCIDGPKTVLLPSRIYQFFVHIRGGAIVPLQTDLVGHAATANFTAKTTHDVQQNPVDLHINPLYEMVSSNDQNISGWCNATGRLLNDDGEVLEYVGMQNRYAFTFSSMCTPGGSFATNITLGFNHTDKADNQKNATGSYNLTMNDFLGKIVIYQADEMSGNFNMAADYNLTVHWTNTTKPAT